MSTPPLRLAAHDRFTLTDEMGQDRAPRGQKTRALLAMLALAPDGTRTRAWLREHLWSDRGEAQGAASLRQCLAELRRALGDRADRVIRADRRSVSLAPSAVTLEPADGIFLRELTIADPAFAAWRDAERSAGRGPAPAERRRSLNDLRAANVQPTLVVCAPLGPDGREHAPVLDLALRHVGAQISAWRTVTVLSPARISRTSRGGIDLDAVRDRHGCEYALELVRIEEEGRTHLSASLQDTWGALRWSHLAPWPDDLAERGAILDEIAARTATVIDLREQRIAASAPAGQATRALVARGRWHLHRMTAEDAAQAGALFASALERAPDAIAPRLNAALALFMSVFSRGGAGAALARARDMARALLRDDDRVPSAFCLVAACESLLRDRVAARAAVAEALRLAPSFPLANAQHGANLVAEGRPEEAIGPLRRAVRLGAEDPRVFMMRAELAMALMLAGRHVEATVQAEGAIAVRTGYWHAHLVRCIALWRGGDRVRAHAAAQGLRQLRPQIALADLDWLPLEEASVRRALWSDYERALAG